LINICDDLCGHCGRCEADPRTPCAQCDTPTDGVWCERCMAEWRKDEEAKRYAAQTHEQEKGAA
jgi:hypothetical protein